MYLGATEGGIDDATILHMRGQQAQRELCRFFPADFRLAVEHRAFTCQQHIAFTI
ncbi:hypothetical protein D3C81_1861610 [compost metagenome]